MQERRRVPPTRLGAVTEASVRACARGLPGGENSAASRGHGARGPAAVPWRPSARGQTRVTVPPAEDGALFPASRRRTPGTPVPQGTAGVCRGPCRPRCGLSQGHGDARCPWAGAAPQGGVCAPAAGLLSLWPDLWGPTANADLPSGPTARDRGNQVSGGRAYFREGLLRPFAHLPPPPEHPACSGDAEHAVTHVLPATPPSRHRAQVPATAQNHRERVGQGASSS